MSLLPLLYDDFIGCPARRDNLFSSIFSPDNFVSTMKNSLNQFAQLEKDNSITVDKDKFQANVDVQQFKPEEISVKLTDNVVSIEGKHEEKQDEHGFISRHFVRKYTVPEDCDVQKLKTSLSSDGVLSITAPKKPEGKQVEYKTIPITLTGPVKRLEQKSKEEQKAE